MNLARALKLYAIALAVFFALDLLWLGVIAQGLYARYLGALLRADVLWPPAVAFYLLFLIGLLVFVIVPADRAGSVKRALALGAFYGFITYQTYELTNYAMVHDWPWQLVPIDIAWGVVLSGAVSALTVALGRKVR